MLLQLYHPVAYAIRALNSVEQKYPQIDKELLAIEYGSKKYHTYAYVRNIGIRTDHQPLKSITKKPLWMASPRLQKLHTTCNATKLKRKDMCLKRFLVDTLFRAIYQLLNQLLKMMLL